VHRRTHEQKRGEGAPLEETPNRDRRWRESLHVAETIKAEQNRLSKEFAQTRDEDLKNRLKEMAEKGRAELAEAEAVKRDLDDLLLRVPNIFDGSGPVGESEGGKWVVGEGGGQRGAGTSRTHVHLSHTTSL